MTPPQSTMGPVLVVDDDEGMRRMLSRFVKQQLRPVRIASTADEAIAQIGAHDDWAGFLIDVSLGAAYHGGLEVLAAARRVFPSVPAAIVSASNSRDVINRAAALSATFLCKPFGPEELNVFLERVSAADAGLGERIEGRLHVLAQKWNLTPRETDILGWLVAGRTKEAYLTRSGITALSYRALVGRLLAKADATRTSDLVANVLREELRARRLAGKGEEPT
ncbi:MAG: DNA-binding response regulator [Labilithrix sp.]|nr:DNA-binding response regulator [Labilithrix sp.]